MLEKLLVQTIPEVIHKFKKLTGRHFVYCII